MGYNQEAYDAECAALARALENCRDEPGPGQMYAIQARKHIATLRRGRPDITIEIRWCPVHKGVPGNKKADGWAKFAAEVPDARGVECAVLGSI
jgi:hypothetical protein